MVFLGAFSPDPSEPRAELVPPVLTSSSPSPSSSPFFCCLFVGLLVCCCCCCCCFVFCLECLFMLVRLCSIYMCFVRSCVFVCSSVRFVVVVFFRKFWRQQVAISLAEPLAIPLGPPPSRRVSYRQHRYKAGVAQDRRIKFGPVRTVYDWNKFSAVGFVGHIVWMHPCIYSAPRLCTMNWGMHPGYVR